MLTLSGPQLPSCHLVLRFLLPVLRNGGEWEVMQSVDLQITVGKPDPELRQGVGLSIVQDIEIGTPPPSKGQHDYRQKHIPTSHHTNQPKKW